MADLQEWVAGVEATHGFEGARILDLPRPLPLLRLLCLFRWTLQQPWMGPGRLLGTTRAALLLA